MIIMVNAGGRVLCKVMEKTEEGYLLRYTSVPPGYDSWIRERRLNI